MRALKIVNRVLEVVDIEDPDGADSIREIIGNTFSSLFTFPTGIPGHALWGFCDDEFLFHDPPQWNVMISPMFRRDIVCVSGPIVILGGNMRTGDSVGLTNAEVARFRIETDDELASLASLVMVGQVLPVLVYDDPRSTAHHN